MSFGCDVVSGCLKFNARTLGSFFKMEEDSVLMIVLGKIIWLAVECNENGFQSFVYKLEKLTNFFNCQIHSNEQNFYSRFVLLFCLESGIERLDLLSALYACKRS